MVRVQRRLPEKVYFAHADEEPGRVDKSRLRQMSEALSFL